MVYVVAWTREWGSSWGGGRAGFVWLPGFFFFSVLHHAEPNRAMLVGVGGVAATVSASLFRNGNGSYSVITRLQ